MPFQSVADVRLYFDLIDCTEPWRMGNAPVVFLHGLGGNHAAWFYQVPAFCSRFPTMTVDLRNHGQSTAVQADFGIADMAADVVRLLRAMGIERAHIVGLSLGGMIALQIGVDHPLSVASLVLADTLAGTPPGFEEVAQTALRFIEEGSMAAIAKARITNAFSPGVDPVMLEYLVDEVAKNDKAAYVRAARAGFSFNVRARLREISKPTLVLVGEQDTVTPALLAEELANGIPGAQLVRIPGAGHISNMERPLEFNRTVLDFIAGVPQ